MEYFFEFVYRNLYVLTGNYGLSLILLSLVVSLILLPLQNWADKLRRRDKEEKATFAPALEAIQIHYRGTERFYYTQALHHLHDYHPVKSLRGLAGLLIQLPFFIGAYRFIGNYESFTNVSFLFINDLAKPDGLLKGINLLPVAMTFVNLTTAALFLPAENRSEKFQLFGLSLFFLMILYNAPAALLIYWTMNNILSFFKEWGRFHRESGELSLPKPADALEKAKGLLFHRTGESLLFLSIALLFYLTLNYLLIGDVYSKTPASRQTGKLIILISGVCFFYLTARFLCRHKRNSKGIVLLILILFVWGAIGFLGTNYVFRNYKLTSIERLRELLMITLLVASTGVFLIQFPLRPTINRLSRMINSSPTHLGIFGVNAIILALTLFVVNPISIFFSSPSDLGGDASLIVDYGLRTALPLLILLAGLFAIKKIRNGLSLFVLLAALLSLFYSFVYVRDYGILRNMRFVNQSLLINQSLMVYLIDFFVIGTVLFLTFRFSKKSQYVFTFFSTVMFCIVLFNTSLYAYNQGRYNNKGTEETAPDKQSPLLADHELSELETQLALSPDHKNIVVIVLDAFPTHEFDNYLAENPDYNGMLDGFTWYRNAVSGGNFTMSGSVGLVGGHTNTVRKINETADVPLEKVFQRTWKNHSDFFTNRGYAVSYFSPPWVDQGYFKKDINNNLMRSDIMQRFWRSSPSADISEWGVRAFNGDYGAAGDNSNYNLAILARLSLFKAMPYFLKRPLYLDIQEWLFDTTIDYRSYMQKFVGTESLFHSLNQLTNDSAQEPRLHFIWSNIMIRPFHINKEANGPSVEEIKSGEWMRMAEEQQAKYSVKYIMKQMERYFNRLKELDLYDNTAIIFINDHGNGFERVEGWNPFAIYALLMVKDFDQKGTLTIDETTLMSNVDLFAITSRMATGKSADIIPDPTLYPQQREVEYWATKHGNWDTLLNSRYDVDFAVKISGNVYKKEDWKRIE